MAFGEKYFMTWNDFGGTEHEIKLLQEGGSGTTQLDIPETTPYQYSVRGGKKAQIENQIFGSEVKVNFVVPSAQIAAIDAIFESDYKEWKIEHYYNSALDWVGYLQPDNFSRDYVKLGDYYFISMSAVDGLANLKNIEFTNFSDGSQFDDRVTIMTTLKRALEHIGFELDFRVQLGTFCTNDSLMTSTELALDKVTNDSRRFQKTKDGRLTNTNIYKVISELLEPFSCYLIQSQAQYWIINTREDNSFYFPVPWTTLTVGARTASDIKIDITGDEDFTNRGNFQKIRPLETVGVTFRDRNVQDNALSNGDFHIASTSEWVEVFTYFIFDTVPFESNFELSAVINNEIQPVPTEPTSFHSVVQSIAARSESDQIQVTFKVRCNVLRMDPGFSGPSFDETVKVSCRIRKGTPSGEIINSGQSEILLSETDSSFRQYTNYFNITEDDDYFIEFVIDKLSATFLWSDYAEIDVRFDDISIIAAFSTSEDITFDSYKKVSNSDSSFTDSIDIETQFGDSASGTDIGAFKISGTLTQTWSRFGKTEDISLNFLVAKNIIENFSKYKDYIRLTIIDDTDRLLPHSLIQINSSIYQIVSQSATFKGGLRKELKVELMEVLNAAVNVTIQEVGLSSVDGDGGSSSPFDDAVTNPSTNPGQPGIVGTLQQVTNAGNLTTKNIGITSTDNSYFTGGGNFGIGTVSPQHPLQIENSGSNSILKLGSNTTNKGEIWSRGIGNSTAYRDFRIIGNDIVFNTSTSDEGTASAARVTIKHTTGNVGINKIDPDEKLHIIGNAKIDDTILSTNPVTLGGTVGSLVIDAGSTGGYEGLNIGGRAAFIHDNANETGLYNDVDQEWLFKATHNAASEMYYNGVKKFETTVEGAKATGLIFADEALMGDLGAVGYGSLILTESSVGKVLISGSAGGHSYILGSFSLGSVTKKGMLTVNQTEAAGVIPTLHLTQADLSEELIKFDATIGVGNPIEAVAAKTLTPTHFIKINVEGVGDIYFTGGTIA